MAHALETLIPGVALSFAAGAVIGLAWLHALRASLAPAASASSAAGGVAASAGPGPGAAPPLPGARAVLGGALTRTAAVGLALTASGLLAGPAAIAAMGAGFAVSTRLALRRATRGGEHAIGRDGV